MAVSEKGERVSELSGAVHRPAHYGPEGMQVIDFAEAHDLGRHAFNITKYVVRADHGRKGEPLKDLGKAAWYLMRLVIERFGHAAAEAVLSEVEKEVRPVVPGTQRVTLPPDLAGAIMMLDTALPESIEAAGLGVQFMDKARLKLERAVQIRLHGRGRPEDAR